MSPSSTPDDSYATDPDIPPPPPEPVRANAESDARMWAAFAHLAGLVTLAGIPGIFGCLIIWLWKRDTHPLIDDHGKEAVNFQLSLLILMAAGAALVLLTCGIGAIVFVPVAALFSVLVIVFPIIATVQASEGRRYRYPLTIRLID